MSPICRIAIFWTVGSALVTSKTIFLEAASCAHAAAVARMLKTAMERMFLIKCQGVCTCLIYEIAVAMFRAPGRFYLQLQLWSISFFLQFGGIRNMNPYHHDKSVDSLFVVVAGRHAVVERTRNTAGRPRRLDGHPCGRPPSRLPAT